MTGDTSPVLIKPQSRVCSR